MVSPVLVTYATRSGTTAGVAEFVAETLMAHGVPAEARPMQEVADLAPYSAVVAGSAIQGCALLPEAVQFIRTHQADLARRPFATFIVCMTLAMKNEQWKEQADVTPWLDPVRALVTPTSEGYFAGALDLSKIPSFADRLKFRVSIMTGVWSEGDHRDWEAIRAWASDLPGKMHLQTEALPA